MAARYPTNDDITPVSSARATSRGTSLHGERKASTSHLKHLDKTKSTSLDLSTQGKIDHAAYPARSPVPAHGKHLQKKKRSQSKTADDEVLVEGCLRLMKKVPLGSPTMALCMDEAGSTVAVGCSNGLVPIYDIASEQRVYTIGHVEENPQPVTRVHFFPSAKKELPSTKLAVAHSNGAIHFWDVRDNLQLTSFHESERQVFSMCFDNTHHRMATGGSDSKINIYDLHKGCIISRLQRSAHSDSDDGHSRRVYSVQFHPLDENLLISGGWDDCVHFWDKRQQTSIRHCYGPHVAGDSLSFKSDGQTFLAGSWTRDNTLMEYDFGSGNLLATYGDKDVGYFSHVYACHYMGTDQRVITAGGSNRNLLRLIDTYSGGTVARVSNLASGVFDVASVPARPVEPVLDHDDQGTQVQHIDDVQEQEEAVADDKQGKTEDGGESSALQSENAWAADSLTDASQLAAAAPTPSRQKFRGYLSMCAGNDLYLLQHGMK